MPKTKIERVVFGIIMSVTMALGMEIYNVATNMGYGANFSSITYAVFLKALKEASFMWIVVFIVSSLYGNRLGRALAMKKVNPEKDNPFLVTVMIQCCTVLIMCPSMSLAGSVIFTVIIGRNPLINLPAIWIGTVIKNFPMALLYNLFFAGPFTRALFNLIFRKKETR